MIELRLQHEAQHQEPTLTDPKHLFFRNLLRPAYRDRWERGSASARQPHWIRYPGCLHRIGHAGSDVAFDNESPRHSVYVSPFELAAWPVSNAEFAAFIEDGGYGRPD